MANREVSVREWIGNFVTGKYDATDVHTQCDAGWYDWFCKDTSLPGKTRKLGHKVLRVARSKKINPDTMYVWFKNNCPCVGKLYDDFRFADMETGDVIYTITPCDGHDIYKGKASVWGRENNFEVPLVEGTWADVLKFFEVK
jgi:hypothetical protein